MLAAAATGLLLAAAIFLSILLDRSPISVRWPAPQLGDIEFRYRVGDWSEARFHEFATEPPPRLVFSGGLGSCYKGSTCYYITSQFGTRDLARRETVYILYCDVGLPFLLVFCFAAYPALAFIRGPLRRWRRHRKGLCLNCGYNLRGLTEPRCPECAKAFDPKLLAARAILDATDSTIRGG